MKMLLIMMQLLVAGSLMGTTIWEFSGSPHSVNPFNSRGSNAKSTLAYFNPALLPYQKPGTDIALFAIYRDLDIKLNARPDGSDISESIFDARKIEPDGSSAPLDFKPLPTSLLSEARGEAFSAAGGTYLSIGIQKDLIPNKFQVALTALIPVGDMMVQRPFYADEREQYFSNSLQFERYGDRLESFAVAFGAGYKINNSFSLGVGGSLSIVATADTLVYISDASTQEISDVQPGMKMQSLFSPHFAVVFRPERELTFGLTVHLPYYNDINVNMEMIFFNYENDEGEHSQKMDLAYRYSYNPLKIGGTAEYQVNDQVALLTTILFTRWSEYNNRSQESVDSDYYHWSDTFNLSAGITYTGKHDTVGIDVTYDPSPVPDQVGRTNYVDSDRAAIAFGYEYRMRVLSMNVKLMASLQVHYLFERKTVKDPNAPDPVFDEYPDSINVMTGDRIGDSAGLQSNNPGYPGYKSSGMIYAGTVSLTLDY